MEITLGQFINNMEKNGYPQITGELWADKWDEVKQQSLKDITQGGCALGQAYWNTFHNYDVTDSFFRELNAEKIDIIEDNTYGISYSTFTDIVVELNDSLGVPIPEIAKFMRKLFKDQLNRVIWVANTQPLKS